MDPSPPPALAASADRAGSHSRVHGVELALLALLVIALGIVWNLDYLPMQDYPQHLFQAKLVGQKLTGQPIDSWFTVHLHLTYSVFYLLVFCFSWGGHLLPIEAAGRCAVSVYVVMMGVVAWRLLWWRGRGRQPAYAALLLMPLVFNQSYYMGFITFMYALPLCFWAFLDVLRALREGWTRGRLIAHAVVLALLVVVHSIAFVMFLFVVGGWWLLHIAWFGKSRRLLPPLLIGGGLLLAWLAAGVLSGGQDQGHIGERYWVPLTDNAAYWLLGWTGDRILEGPHWNFAVTWVVVAAVFVVSGIRAGLADRRVTLLAGAGAVMLLAGTIVLPFSFGGTEYFGVRIAEGSYFLMVLMAAMIPVNRVVRLAITAGAALLLVFSAFEQHAIAGEIADIAPMVQVMEPGAAVFPSVLLRSSPELDGTFFLVHLHEVYYYHLAKGGASPYLFEARVASGTPVTFAGATLPAPSQMRPLVRWDQDGPYYRYFLIRGVTPGMDRYMREHANFVAASGPWVLYENKTPATRP